MPELEVLIRQQQADDTRLQRPEVVEAPDPDDWRYRFLMSLSRMQRACFVLHAGGGFSFAEIGEMLGVHRAAVAKHVSRAYVRLRGADPE